MLTDAGHKMLPIEFINLQTLSYNLENQLFANEQTFVF